VEDKGRCHKGVVEKDSTGCCRGLLRRVANQETSGVPRFVQGFVQEPSTYRYEVPTLAKNARMGHPQSW